MSDGLVIVLVAVAMAIGIAGTVVPVLPGLALVWAAALVYGLATGFGVAGWAAFLVITVLAVVGTVAGFVLPHRAAGASGAHQYSIAVAVLGGIIGSFVVPIVGLPLGAALGLFGAELVRTRQLDAAWRSTLASIKGFGLSTLAQLGAGLLMAAVWVAWVVAA